MDCSVGLFVDILEHKDQYYWLTRDQYIEWRVICYGKDKGEASGEIERLIEKRRLFISSQTTTEQKNECLYFIDVATVESVQALANAMS